jgi:hypothetical protein
MPWTPTPEDQIPPNDALLAHLTPEGADPTSGYITAADLASLFQGVMSNVYYATPAGDITHYVGAVDEPAFQNSFINYDNQAAVPGVTGQRSAWFRKYPDGKVMLAGTLLYPDMTMGTVFTLPPGYRPSHGYAFPVVADGSGNGLVTVDVDGNVNYAFGPAPIEVVNNLQGAEGLHLDGLTFDTMSVSA